MNLAQHSYFNLNGHDGRGRVPPIDDHFVFLSADAYTPVSPRTFTPRARVLVRGALLRTKHKGVREVYALEYVRSLEKINKRVEQFLALSSFV